MKEIMEEINLSKILKSDVVVPEIQREYVWGKNERVLNQFIEEIKLKKQLNIGFVYSYEPYKGLKEIFLIDGQQRITTLVLIAFYAAIKEKEDDKLNEFKALMRIASTKPAFSYRVRSCTKEFMLELFKSIDTLDNLRKIENQKWYLDRYKLDMSISSMINAIKIIDNNLKGTDKLYDFIIGEVKFWYFNVGKTSQGEELYITMNSRGESLSDAEQIKPLLFENVKNLEKHRYGKLWDEIEEYFYPLKPAKEDIKVVDTMMDRFIQLILQIENKTEKTIGGSSIARFSLDEIQKVNLETIEYYFNALKIIEQNFKEKNTISLLSCFYEDSQEEKFLFPLAALMKAVYLIFKKVPIQPKFILSNDQKRELLRLYHIVRNSVRRGTIKYVPLLKFLSEYNGEPIYKFFIEYHYTKNEENHVLSKHEMQKIKIISSSESIEKTEEAFWEAQESLEYLLGGSLKPLIAIFADENWTDEILTIFEKRKQITADIFSIQNINIKLSIKHKVNIIDNGLIARAMLTYGDYSKNIGGDNWSFGYKNYWKAIFKDEKGANNLSALISEISNMDNGSLYDNLQSIIQFHIANYQLETKDSRYYFIKYQNTFLANYDGYNVITFWGGWSDYRIEVLNKERLSSYHVNPFMSAIINLLNIPDSNELLRCNHGDVFSSIDLKNGIFITSSSKHAWNVHSERHENLCSVDANLHYNEDSKIYTFTVDLKDDLIEKGVELFHKLKDLK